MEITVKVPNGVTDIFYKTSDGKVYQSHLSGSALNTNTLYVDPGQLQRNCKLQTNVLDATVAPRQDTAEDWELPNINEMRRQILAKDGLEAPELNSSEDIERDADGLPKVEALRKLL